MIKHIVFWNLKEENKEANALELKKRLEALVPLIPEIVKLEVGINVNPSDMAYDICLYSEFESMDTLNTYQNHPEHVKVGEFIGDIRTSRVVCDYEI